MGQSALWPSWPCGLVGLARVRHVGLLALDARVRLRRILAALVLVRPAALGKAALAERLVHGACAVIVVAEMGLVLLVGLLVRFPAAIDAGLADLAGLHRTPVTVTRPVDVAAGGGVRRRALGKVARDAHRAQEHARVLHAVRRVPDAVARVVAAVVLRVLADAGGGL